MSDKSKDAHVLPKASKAPKPVIEQAPKPGSSATGASDRRGTASAERASRTQGRGGASGADTAGSESASAQHGFQRVTIGFFRGLGSRMWEYADAHPHTVLYGLIGFAFAVLILTFGLWDTIVIAVLSGVGVMIGQMVDGESGLYDFFGRMFGRRR